MDMLPWGTNHNLTDEEFYNREWELNNIKTFLETTNKGNAPKILLTGCVVLAKNCFFKKT